MATEQLPDEVEERAVTDDMVTAELPDAELTVRSEPRRELEARLLTWDTIVDTPIGREAFKRGAFSKVDPKKVVLLLGHGNDPTGRGIALEEREDGPYMTFKVSQTQRGDELLTLARDGVTNHVSVGYRLGTTKGEAGFEGGKRVTRITQVDLDHVATTYKPAYKQADIVAIRERTQEGDPAVPETQEVPAVGTSPIVLNEEQLAGLLDRIEKRQTTVTERLMDRLENIELRSRQDIIVPGQPQKKTATLVNWANTALRMLAGERVSPQDMQERALDDIITPDNPGAVPDAFVNDLIGVIDPSRPFLQSTTRIVTPDSGMSIVVPVLSQRSTAAVQGTEKTDIDSTAMKVTNQSFDAVTIAGGADVSQQMIRRAQPSYIDLLLRDLGAAYANEADTQALSTLFAAGTTPGGADIDPEDLTIGEAWKNSINAIGRAPDTIWLSADGVAAFIDAKNDGSNAPLYFRLDANFGVGNAPSGNVSALRPVYVPALTGTGVDVMIGPSSGFAWAEDGTFTLQVDVPSKAGRDIAVVGILFFVPRYPAAFTTYDLGS